MGGVTGENGLNDDRMIKRKQDRSVSGTRVEDQGSAKLVQREGELYLVLARARG